MTAANQMASNSTIFGQAIRNAGVYNAVIRQKNLVSKAGEASKSAVLTQSHPGGVKP